jgi:hypothetical protein
MQRRYEHSVSTIGRLYSAWSVPRGYKKGKEDRLSQFGFETLACQDMSLRAEELELSRVPELAVAVGN